MVKINTNLDENIYLLDLNVFNKKNKHNIKDI